MKNFEHWMNSLSTIPKKKLKDPKFAACNSHLEVLREMQEKEKNTKQKADNNKDEVEVPVFDTPPGSARGEAISPPDQKERDPRSSAASVKRRVISQKATKHPWNRWLLPFSRKRVPLWGSQSYHRPLGEGHICLLPNKMR